MITKKLKYDIFEYDEQTKLLSVNDSLEKVSLSRAEMFSLARFILRVAQKGRPRKK